MTRVLILRPEPGASLTLNRAQKLGLEAVAMPLFVIEPIGWQAPDPSAFDGLLLTSANAVRAGGSKLDTLRGLPAYAVGGATAEAARRRGFDIAAAGTDGVDRLLESIDPDLRLLHLASEDRIAPAGPRQAITAISVYRANERDDVNLSEVGRCIALVHSPRAARRLAELAGERSAIAIAAISAGAAEAAGPGWSNVAIASAPDDEALLALAASLCNSSAL